jgi:hypothetical protein
MDIRINKAALIIIDSERVRRYQEKDHNSEAD